MVVLCVVCVSSGFTAKRRFRDFCLIFRLDKKRHNDQNAPVSVSMPLCDWNHVHARHEVPPRVVWVCICAISKIEKFPNRNFSDSQNEIQKIDGNIFWIDSCDTIPFDAQWWYLLFARSVTCCTLVFIELRTIVSAKFWNRNPKKSKSKSKTQHHGKAFHAHKHVHTSTNHRWGGWLEVVEVVFEKNP
jgi:hypothetical protein